MAEAQTKAFVEFQRVQKSYDGEVLVVKDLNLAIPRGEFLTMLGPLSSPQFLYHKFLVSLIRFQEQAVAYQARGVA